MSNSDLFQVKEDEKNIISSDDLLPLPTSKDIAPADDDQHVVKGKDENNPKDDNITKKLDDHNCESSTINCSENTPEKGSQSEVPNEDGVDGFRTPTSTDHKIPEMTTCPPAPVKKRKASVSTTIHPTLQVDFESAFTDQEDHSGRNIKKSRNLDHQE